MYCSLGISLISLWQDRRLYSANNIKCSLSFFRFILFYFIFFNKKVLKSNKKIMSSQNNQCEKCGEKYMDIYIKWCKPCHINYLKNNFINWTSGNEKIDIF